jgi:hypothetical protein
MFLSLGGVLLRRAITPWATQHRKVVVLVFNSLTGLPLLRMAFLIVDLGESPSWACGAGQDHHDDGGRR